MNRQKLVLIGALSGPKRSTSEDARKSESHHPQPCGKEAGVTWVTPTVLQLAKLSNVGLRADKY
jgi:hypothetical protein